MHVFAVSANAMNQRNFTVSAIIIAKNEEERIEKCIKRVSWCSERIVVDSGSLDRTVVLAKTQGASVVETADSDFSTLRTIGLKYAKGDFIFYVDADEIVTQELENEIIKLISSFDPKNSAHVYRIRRKNYYLNHLWPKEEQLERLFWKSSLIAWHGAIHESAVTRGPVGTLEHPFMHYTHRSLEEMVEKTNRWSEIEAKLRREANHPPVAPWRLLRVMVTGFVRSYVSEHGILAGSVGLVESIYQAFSMFITYAKLFEIQRKRI